MSLTFHWFLPTYGDSRNLMAGGHGNPMHGDRPATLRYLNQVAISMRAGLLDSDGAASEIELTERQLHEIVEKLKVFAGIEG